MDNVVWVNEQDEVLGEVSIGRAHEEGLLHRVSAVYLIDVRGRILVQERAGDSGPLDGRLDHSAAGHVDPGETYEQATERELREELGVDIAGSFHFFGNCTSNEFGGKIRHMFSVYEAHVDPAKLDLKIDPHEVRGVFWADPLEIWTDMKLDPADNKYTGGFKQTLRVYLDFKHLI